LICAPDNENNHLFQMVHGTFCTLGIIFRLTFRLIAGQAHLWQIHELNQDAETVQCPSLVHPSDKIPLTVDVFIPSMG
ncbi:MAG TPA: hypothetical protein P5184_00490, partial [Bacteroidales bacterium]|nr:hypothetical protein [Bacteroidales bacterium]